MSQNVVKCRLDFQQKLSLDIKYSCKDFDHQY